ncbi:MAG: hypothetical protein IPP17_15925 [Bacteroidetes bacterium]|nr:hypothetical protein [Bacteroidota bacterium]
MSKEFPESEVQIIANMLAEAGKDLNAAVFRKIPNFQDFVADRVGNGAAQSSFLGSAAIEKRLEGLYHHSAISKWKLAKVLVEPRS